MKANDATPAKARFFVSVVSSVDSERYLFGSDDARTAARTKNNKPSPTITILEVMLEWLRSKSRMPEAITSMTKMEVMSAMATLGRVTKRHSISPVAEKPRRVNPSGSRLKEGQVS